MARIVIIGGGIAGLAAAYTLERESAHEVVLLEGSDRLGGKVGTVRVGELLIERGPDSVFSVKKAGVELMEELGLRDEMVGPKGGEFSILVGGKLHKVPRALATLMPSASGVLEKVGFLSAEAKKRFLMEKDAPKGEGGDESIASFFRRRFGTKFSTLVAEPLLAGIHAGDPEKLSMKALYPTYLGMEQKNGSLTGAAPPPPPPSGTAPRLPAFVTLKGGMETLVERIEANLRRTQVHKGVRVERIERDGEGVLVRGDVEGRADQAIVCVPAYVATRLFSESAPIAAEVLGRIRFVSTAVVTLAYPMSAFPKGLEGNGFLVPYTEPSDISGCTWSSQKWDDRAPSDVALLRAFMGQDGGLNVDDHSDEALIEKAEVELRRLLKPRSEPSLRRVDRWTKSMPQYEIGHLDLMAEAEAGLGGLPVLLAGSSYRGNGIPDCVRQGREAARRIIEKP